MIHTLSLRPAIAMIELIFALVVMGITLMSAPMLISTATQSSTIALQQEGIHEAVSRVNMVMTYAWDENDTNTSCIPPVLHVNGGDPQLNEAADNRRIGVPIESNSRTFRCGDNEFGASILGGDNGEPPRDDIDDFGGTALVDLTAIGAGGQDYLERTTVQIGTGFSYLSDIATYNSAALNYVPGGTPVPGPGYRTSNIKSITVTLTSASGASELSGKNIVLRAFSCNIGGREFEKRVMP